MANEYLQRTPTSTGNRRVFTWSGWVKSNIDNKSGNGNAIFMCAAQNTGNLYYRTRVGRYVVNDNDFGFNHYDGANDDYGTQALKRDHSNWENYICAVDTTQEQTTDRVKIYLNGVYQSDLTTVVAINRNLDTYMNGTSIHFIGADGWTSTPNSYSKLLMSDVFFVDGQALTPDVFGFYKQGKGYISVGSTQATDFRPGQWVPKTPRVIKTEINRRGGFGVNGFYLPMNDSNNFGADFHCDPNSIIILNEKLPQPRVGVATTASVGLGYTDALRADPYAANLVLALPFVSGGLNSGFGDYSAAIKGSGSAKTITNNSSVSIANTHGYYGSSVYIDSVNYLSSSSADFAMGTGDFTVEGWINQTGGDTTNGGMFSSATSDGSGTGIVVARDQCWLGNNSVAVSVAAPGGTFWPLNQWTHIAFVRKTNIISVFVNGVAAGITTNVTSNVGKTDAAIGRRYYNNSSFTPIAYIQDLRVYKGVAKYTGGFDVPRPYTPVGIATWRAVPDTTANNFATMNPLIEARPSSGSNSPSNSTIVTFADGNLNLSNSASSGNAQRMVSFATIGISTGKWYYEEIPSSNSRVGLSKGFQQLNYVGTLGSGSGLESNVTYGAGGAISLANNAYYNTATTLTPPSYNNTNIIGVSIDASLGENNLTVRFYKDGVGVSTLTGVGATSPVREWFPTKTMESSGSGDQRYFNFGQNPTFSGNTTAGTFTDSNGKGLFKYQPPSGFLALCEDNLPTPAISNPGQYFKTVLWTGDGNSGRSIVGVGFTPDLVWIKDRNNGSYNHLVSDSVRGAGFALRPSATAEETASGIRAFSADGFSISNDFGYNVSGNNHVAWCWRAGAGTTSTNTNGSITSVVSVNQDAGFSIVSWTGNGVEGATIGHGLNKAPKFIVQKNRDGGSAAWRIWHSYLGDTYGLGSGPVYITFDTGAATYDSQRITGSTATTFRTTGTATPYSNSSGTKFITYCWAEIEGFSKFGSYVGNGSTDGPFVWTGFSPAWIMIKRTDSTQNWIIIDNARSSTNTAGQSIFANTSDTEYTDLTNREMDFLSNGFKIRAGSGAERNASGGTYIFAAFAQSPFSYSNSK